MQYSILNLNKAGNSYQLTALCERIPMTAPTQPPTTAPTQPTILGTGTYAQVILEAGYAVKRTNVMHLETIMREIGLLRAIRHPCVVRLENVVWDADTVDLVMPLYKTSLDRLVRTGPRPVDVRLVYKLAHDVTAALAYLHSRGIIHCDLKPANVLVSGDQAAICDFGLSVMARERFLWANIQTCTYRAPEVDASRRKIIYSDKIDMWSLGCILFEMCTGAPFVKYVENLNDSSVYALIALNLPVLESRTSRMRLLHDIGLKYIRGQIVAHLHAAGVALEHGFVSLIAMCLIPNVNKRIDASSALSILTGICVRCGIEIDLNMASNSGNIRDINTHNNSNISTPARVGRKTHTKPSLPQIEADLWKSKEVLIGISNNVLGLCSKHVAECAQSIYERAKSGTDRVTKACCIYLAACVLSANVYLLSEVIDSKYGNSMKTNRCIYLMQKINGHIIG